MLKTDKLNQIRSASVLSSVQVDPLPLSLLNDFLYCPRRAALRLGLIDQVVVNLVPVVFGSGRPFLATVPRPGRFFSTTRPRSSEETAGRKQAIMIPSVASNSVK